MTFASLVRRHRLREIDEQPVDRGRRDLAEGRDVARVEPADLMDDDTFELPETRCADVQGAVLKARDPAQLRQCDVAERGAGPAASTAAIRSPSVGERRLADDVDPAVSAVQRAAPDAPRHRAVARCPASSSCAIADRPRAGEPRAAATLKSGGGAPADRRFPGVGWRTPQASRDQPSRIYTRSLLLCDVFEETEAHGRVVRLAGLVRPRHAGPRPSPRPPRGRARAGRRRGRWRGSEGAAWAGSGCSGPACHGRSTHLRTPRCRAARGSGAHPCSRQIAGRA